MATEARRKRKGIHLKRAFSETMFEYPEYLPWLGLLPGMNCNTLSWEQELLLAEEGKQFRCILSGIGGDELLGGVPTPAPELANLLLRGRPIGFLRRATAWSMA